MPIIKLSNSLFIPFLSLATKLVTIAWEQALPAMTCRFWYIVPAAIVGLLGPECRDSNTAVRRVFQWAVLLVIDTS